MIPRAWRPVAAAVLVGTPAYLYYRSRQEAQQTFDFHVRVRGPDGKPEMSTRTAPLLPMSVFDSRIREHATLDTYPQPGGPIWKYTTAFLPSNDPIEDANSSQIIQRDESDPSAPGDYLFFAVMDGHGGRETSQLLSRILIRAVALELNSLVTNPKAELESNFVRKMMSSLWSSSSSPSTVSPSVSHPERVSRAIQDAFTKLDAELLDAPLKTLASNMDPESLKNKVIPDLSQHPLAVTSMLPAISGIPFHSFLIHSMLTTLRELCTDGIVRYRSSRFVCCLHR
jgi:pyruvate dehydrogenase phosphatase